MSQSAPQGTWHQEPVVRPGAAQSIPTLLDAWQANNVLVVASPGAVRRTGLRKWFDGRRVELFQDFAPNPQLSSVLRGVDHLESQNPDAVVAVGGGSTLDTGKMLRLMPGSELAARRALAGDKRLLRASPPPLLAVPTTAGTGSEITQFATVYLGATKFSLDDPRVRPDAALIDPLLARGCPASVTASCALDAVAHAIESNWSLLSSPASRALAHDALARLVPALGTGVQAPSTQWWMTVSRGAMSAGMAINLTRTTAGHACAYPTTAHFGVSHGLACALHLIWLIPLTAARAASSPLGPIFVRHRLAEIASLLGAPGPDSVGATFEAMVSGLGFATRLGDYGIGTADLGLIADGALGSNRLVSHPICLDRATVMRQLRERL